MARMEQQAGTALAGGEPPGLSGAEAAKRLAEYGLNEIAEEQPHPIVRLLGKFWAPIPWMLEATVLLQLVLGKAGEAAIIGALLLFNAAVSFVQENRADQALSLLRRRLAVSARVRRDGTWQPVPARTLVPGDVVRLRMGDLAPADVKLHNGALLIDQSALTGESVPVEAGAGALAYAGAIIRRGEATGEVAATGARTYFGRTAELVRSAHARSHLQQIVFTIVRVLAVIDAVLIAALIAYAAVTGLPFADLAPFALILLVASVPVALPAMFTLATALGAVELAHSGVLVTHLGAIEEAAGMDVLCSDKTGTITENRLTLAVLVPAAPGGDEALLRLAVMASDPATQDPLDMAIFRAAADRGVAQAPAGRVGFVPFDPQRRYSEGVYIDAGARIRVAKGAPSAVMALLPGATDRTDDIDRLASQGYRVLAVASGAEGTPRLAGLLAFEDPVRQDSAALIEGLRELGVRVLMLTGDNLAAARAVAGRIGIGGRAAPSDVVARLDGADVLAYDVYARVFPEHKFRLVELLQGAGHVVGMTGDGVNDAPALKQADMGIAVANATDAARAAAGMVLTNPGLVDVLTAIKISRRIYQRMLTYSINKIVKTLEIAVFLSLGVMLTGTFVITPLLIVLLLFTNDFVTMSIATDRVAVSPQPDRWSIRNLMLAGGMMAGLVLVLSFGLFFLGRNVLGLPLAELQTLVFVMLVATGQGNVYLVRERGPCWRSRPGSWLIASSLADIALVAVMAAKGILMAPASPALIAGLLAVVPAYLLLADGVKVAIFRRFAIR
ncbi:MAG TPA: plasma-membrane proton-efflux P-type ATPase [Stellaceae bacterium]|nr:plasma-membrane proton-efflux P-type ATPase [Stellaceae bacterium]